MNEEFRATEYGDDDKFAQRQREALYGRVGEDDDESVQEDAPDVLARLNAIEAAQKLQGELLDKLVEGVNNIGGMMNEVADAFGQVMDQVSKGGIGALLGGMMGKKNNGD